MKKVLFVLTSHDSLGDTGKSTGFFLAEVTHPHKVFIEAGYEVDFVSPQGGEPPIDGFDMDDPINKAFMEDVSNQQAIQRTLEPEEVEADEYSAIFYAGGHGTMWDLPDNKALAKIAAEIYENDGIVGAVCHGPVGLVNIMLSDGSYLVSGKEVSCFTNEEEEAVELADVVPFLLEDKLTERGGLHSKADNFQEHVVISDRLVTGQNPASAKGVGEAMVEMLEG